MFISNISVARPVFATMLNLVLIVFGLFAYSKLDVDLMPNIDLPFVVVNVVYPGADPRSVEQKVVEPIEKAVNGIEGLDKMTASASANIGFVILQFKMEVDGEKAAQRVRDKLSTVQLPQECRQPLVTKVDFGAAPIIQLALTQKNGNLNIGDIAKNTIKPRLEQVKGVGSVDIIGLRDREIHINLDRTKLITFGLSPVQVMQSIQSQMSEFPSGKVENTTTITRISTEGSVKTLEQIKKIVIILKNGQKIRIEDIATIEDTIADEETYASYNGKQTLLLLVKKQSGGNTVAIANEIKIRAKEIEKQLSIGNNSIELNIALDNSIFIKSSLDAVQLDLILGAILAIVIVLFFLHDWRATIISGLAIPTAVIGTIYFVQTLGFTLNVITSMALSLSIGILVDDAIVVIENIYRRIQLGDPPKKAATVGTSEIGLAAIAITLAIVAVFGPVAFMDGIIGKVFYSFGLTVTVAVLLSLFVAFTLTPMLSSKLLRSGHGHTPFVFIPIAKVLTLVDNIYKKMLIFSLKHRIIVVGASFLLVIWAGFAFGKLPKNFFPAEDKSEFIVKYTLNEGTSITQSKMVLNQVDTWLKKLNGVDVVIATIASDNNKKPNYLQFNVKLISKDKRNFSDVDLIDKIRQTMLKSFVKTGEKVEVSVSSGGPGGKTITIALLGNNYEEIVIVANKLKKYISKIDGMVDVDTSEPPKALEYKVITNPTRAADLGLSTTQIGQTLRLLFEGMKIADFEDNGTKYDVKLKLDNKDTTNIESVNSIFIPNSMGNPVSLNNVSQIMTVPSAANIERNSGMRSITVSANYSKRDLNTAVSQIEETIRAKDFLPTGINYSVEGSAKMMQDSMKSFATTLLLSIILVYMVLAAQFESFITPIVILFSVLYAIVGVPLGLNLIQREVSIYGFIGLLLLVGIVTKNGILLIDFALQRIRAGMNVTEALIEAGSLRLRPILMTTFAMIFGMIPIATGHGEGGEARSPLAIIVISGLISSTFLTLLALPSVFSILESIKKIFIKSAK